MTVLVVVLLCVVVVGLVVVVLVTRNRLQAQRGLTAEGNRRLDERAAELAQTSEALEQSERARAAADEQVSTVSAERDAARDEATSAAAARDQARADAEAAAARANAADEQARVAGERAAAAESERDQARTEADEAIAAQERAEEAAAAAEERAVVAASAAADATVPAVLDPDLLWTLEQARSERTWRNSVALGPDDVSVFAAGDTPLITALHVELDAAREEVGADVELDVDLLGELTAAVSLLTLRAAQELVAGVVHRSESTTLRVRADGDDLLITVDAVDENGSSVTAPSLAVSSSLAPIEGGVRIPGGAPRPSEPESI